MSAAWLARSPSPVVAVCADCRSGGVLASGLSAVSAAHGRFDDNFFIMPAGERVVHFLPFGQLDVEALRATLRVEHVRMYV